MGLSWAQCQGWSGQRVPSTRAEQWVNVRCRGIEPDEARRRLAGTDKSLQGNLDPCTLYASPETIRAEVETMVNKFGTQGYIANLGHGMHPTMNPDHAHAFIKSVQEVSAHANAKAE